MIKQIITLCTIIYIFLTLISLFNLYSIIKQARLSKYISLDAHLSHYERNVYIVIYDTNYKINSRTIRDLIQCILESYNALDDTQKKLENDSINNVEVLRLKAFSVYQNCQEKKNQQIWQDILNFFSILYTEHDEMPQNMDGWYKPRFDKDSIYKNFFIETLSEFDGVLSEICNYKPNATTTDDTLIEDNQVCIKDIKINVYSDGITNNNTCFNTDMYYDELSMTNKAINDTDMNNSCQTIIALSRCFQELSIHNSDSWFYEIPQFNDTIPCTDNLLLQNDTVISNKIWQQILDEYNNTSVNDENYRSLRKFVNMYMLINEFDQNNKKSTVDYILSKSKHIASLKCIIHKINHKFETKGYKPLIIFKECNNDICHNIQTFTLATC